MRQKATQFCVGDSIELHRFALVGDGTVRRTDGNVRLDGFYEIVEVNKPEAEDEDQVVLVDIQVGDEVKTVDFMPNQTAESE